MNVLYIVGGEGNRYGSERIAISLLSAGKENGINYTVIIAHEGAVSDTCARLGINYFIIPFTFFVYKAMNSMALDCIKKTIWRARSEFLTKRAIRIIEKKVDMKSIDIIHTNLSRDLLGGLLAERNNIPHVWHIQELYKAHYQLSFLRKNQIEWMGSHANLFLAISDTVAREWIESGLPEEKVSVVFNGIEMTSIIPKDTPRCGGGLRIVMVGHIVPAKGQLLVIERIGKLPKDIKNNIKIDLIGGGKTSYKELIRKKAEEDGINLTFRGYCDNVEEILYDYDIGINCSKGEGFGLTTVEYMAAGLCPVVANTGANEEIVHNTKNGYVFDYYDDNSLPSLISYLYFHQDEMNRTAISARKYVTKEYSAEKMQQEVYSFYCTLMKR